MSKKITSLLLGLVMAISMVIGQAGPVVSLKAAGSTLIIHYGGRENNDYKGWNLWLWEDGKDGKQVDFSAEDSYGKIAVCNISAPGKVGFIVRLNEWEAKDVEEDRFVEVGDSITEIWLTSGKKEYADRAPKGAKKYDIEQMNKARQAVYNQKDAVKIDVHYYTFNNKYDNVSAYAWLGDKDGGSYELQSKDSFGGLYKIGFINKKKAKTVGLRFNLSNGEADCENDRVIDLTQAKNNRLQVYVVQGNKEVYYDKKDAIKQPVIASASFVSASEIVFSLADTVDTSKEKLVKQFTLTDQDGKDYELLKVWSENPGKEKSASVILKDEVDFANSYTLAMKNHISCPVSVSTAFSTEAFEKAYTYEGDDLGANYTKESTDFRLWAPTASQVDINFYSEGSGDNLIETQSMMRDVNGTWVYEASGDMKNTYYTYSVTVDGITKEAVDPYARTTGVNGNRGMVIDLDSTDPSGFAKEKSPAFKNIQDAVIYELQIRDLSADSSSGIKNTGKYLGLTEKGTKNSNGESTGLDHMVDMGITHLHIMPSYDYATVDESKSDDQYNWGYDPKNYNVPEGSYSTDPTDGNVRVNEYKQMVQALHENGIRVVMDVVYNHTFNIDDSNFQKIVPDYYYRKSGDSFTNGSGCGNETASERSMMRKYIVDSVVYWVKEYHVDGFRFDLMGVHDIETMQEVRAALDEIDPSIIIYGEGWTGGESGLDESLRAVKANMSNLEGIAAFSDDFRDGLKGNVFDEKDTGFLAGNDAYLEDVKASILGATENEQIDVSKLTKSKGAWAVEPGQCINYVSCHDNLTLWDKLQVSVPDAGKEEYIAMNKLAAAMTFTSEGIPFMMAGEEFLRSKPSGDGYDANSYKSGDEVNSLKWDTLTENADVYNYYKGLIKFRKAHAALRLTKIEDLQDKVKFIDGLKGAAVGYTISGKPNGEKADAIMVIHNGNKKDITVNLPDTDTWSVYINGEKAGTDVIEEVKDSVKVPKTSSVVLVKESKATKAINKLNKIDNWVFIVAAIVVILLIIFILIFNSKGLSERRRRKKVSYYK
ncbi:MAG: type I pullulanase [Lachnospiraceae bacterium]|nr:type I pullulanase [Lachnospiraceae bacterium]